jgi:anti-sigma regulatory factor (Ser/Thr protein kinase)
MATEPSSQIVIQAKLEQLPDLQHWVEALAVDFHLPPPLVNRIDLCLTELVANIIAYGYPDGAVGTVSISFWRQLEQIITRIDDDGAAFDPTSYVLPGLPRSLADASGGGRGIRLVRHFADELHYLRGAAGNELVLIFRTPRPRAHSSAARGARNE